jgi:hypothetical protein
MKGLGFRVISIMVKMLYNIYIVFNYFCLVLDYNYTKRLQSFLICRTIFLLLDKTTLLELKQKDLAKSGYKPDIIT